MEDLAGTGRVPTMISAFIHYLPVRLRLLGAVSQCREIGLRQLRRHRQNAEGIWREAVTCLRVALLPAGQPLDFEIGLSPRRQIYGIGPTGRQTVRLHRKAIRTGPKIAIKFGSRRDITDGGAIRVDHWRCCPHIAIERSRRPQKPNPRHSGRQGRDLRLCCRLNRLWRETGERYEAQPKQYGRYETISAHSRPSDRLLYTAVTV